jgi:hypothetical protein
MTVDLLPKLDQARTMGVEAVEIAYDSAVLPSLSS